MHIPVRKGPVAELGSESRVPDAIGAIPTRLPVRDACKTCLERLASAGVSDSLSG
jgi:hypothetical protein